MIRFFDISIPKPIALQIFNKVSLADQSRLALVCKDFNELLSDTSTKLSQYKYAHQACKVGKQAIVVLAQYEYPFYSQLWLTYRNASKSFSPLTIPPDDAVKICSAMEKGSSILMDILREIELTDFINDINNINAHEDIAHHKQLLSRFIPRI